ncbi:hypothetical protein VPHD479_0111 [Vibrio phage D479]
MKNFEISKSSWHFKLNKFFVSPGRINHWSPAEYVKQTVLSIFLTVMAFVSIFAVVCAFGTHIAAGLMVNPGPLSVLVLGLFGTGLFALCCFGVIVGSFVPIMWYNKFKQRHPENIVARFNRRFGNKINIIE